MKKRILISTGGSGGHVIPALAFYDHLKENFEVYLTLDKRGSKFINQKKYKEAINFLTKGFKIERNSGGYPFHLAICYENLKQYKQSIEHYLLSVNIRKEGLGIEDERTQDSIQNVLRLAKQTNNIKLI